ncbi:MAG: MBOAT family O-acyltransferase [Chitinophagales bacterium]
MLFNSLPFLVFIATFLPIYFALKGRARLLFCLAASYFFYGWWDVRFLSLIVLSTVIDYVLGLKISQTEEQAERKKMLLVSVFMNLGVLAFFKYFNFFTDSFMGLMHTVGIEASWNTLNIILPVGISFYTFQSMSYTIDLYRRKIDVEPDFITFATYISFFPQLVAGPIVRASDLLPQFRKDHKFDWHEFTMGFGQVLVGFFKKVAVADSLALVVDQIFTSPAGFSSLNLVIGVIFYSFQIYCDFSGYSDIAIGLARMMGFHFPMNFRTPYFSKNFSEFWTRWHISLSSWLRDYLYISLGGNRGGTLFTYRNLMITMLLGGLWHGASWAFVLWGFLHGSYLIVQRLSSPYVTKIEEKLQVPEWLSNAYSIALVYFLTCFAWIYFRSPDFETANAIISGILAFKGTTLINMFWIVQGFLLIGMLLLVEVIDTKVDLPEIAERSPVFQVASYALILWSIALLGSFGNSQFIYFQF